MTPEHPPLRRRLFELLEVGSRAGGLSRKIDVFLIILIVVNILAVILETVESMNANFPGVFRWIEIVSVAIFTFEYVLRLWTCKEDPLYKKPWGRLRYSLTPMAIIDMAAILPFFLGAILGIDLRFLRILRLLRILKLTRYSSALTMLLEVIKDETDSFIAGFFILGVLLVISASGVYLAENAAQPDKFGSIPLAMWWAVATLTTVGYGDVTPITTSGRVFGSLIAVVGVGMAALPAGILASGMAERLRRSRETMRNEFRRALEDGVIDAEEQEELEDLRKTLGMSRSLMTEIIEELEKEDASCTCPSCGHQFTPVKSGKSGSG